MIVCVGAQATSSAVVPNSEEGKERHVLVDGLVTGRHNACISGDAHGVEGFCIYGEPEGGSR